MTLQQAESDLAFYHRKYEKVPNKYHLSLLIAAKDRLQKIQWEQRRVGTWRQ